MNTKRCFKCLQVKPLSEFYVHKKMADGRLNKCKECAKLDTTINRIGKIEYYRSYDRYRASRPARRKAGALFSKRWRGDDKRRMAAHNAVARAIKSGTLERKKCERCGKDKVCAHHEDYDKKLDVIWLCQPCHTQRHKEIRSSI